MVPTAVYGGVVHPVESEGSISKDFCLDVVAGMLGLDPAQMRRKHRPMDGSGGWQQQQQVVSVMDQSVLQAMHAFKENWSRYDWTQYI